MAPSLPILVPRSPATRSAGAVTRSLKRQAAAVVTPPLPAEKKPRKASGKKAVAVAAVAAAAATSSSPFPSVFAFSTPPSKATATSTTTRTESFGALVDPSIPVHTLILGTHPSVKSLEQQEYFAHPMNAFWWIAGDCLGFRRAAGLNVSGEPFKFITHVRYDTSEIIPYDAQVKWLLSKGFALWDVVKSCHRKGSLDSDIKQEEPNGIQAFVSQNPSIKRIVFANGGKGCDIFNKHFKEWWESGELKPNNDDFSQRAFGKKYERAMKKMEKQTSNTESASSPCAPITCICAIGVSPAAARYTYQEKRDYWEQHVYGPGLDDYEQSLS